MGDNSELGTVEIAATIANATFDGVTAGGIVRTDRQGVPDFLNAHLRWLQPEEGGREPGSTSYAVSMSN